MMHTYAQRACKCSQNCDTDAKKEIPVQQKLTVSQPGDRFEREADHVADQVMSIPRTSRLPPISRWSETAQIIGRDEIETPEEESQKNPTEPEEATPESEAPSDLSSLLSLKGKSNKNRQPSAAITNQIHSMRGGGQPMNSELRNFFESRFQKDFSNVRLHTNATAANTTKSLNAKAYTVGNDIAISPDEYRPETTAGRKLIAHELTHVVQQANSVQTIMRACDCAKLGYSDPSQDVQNTLKQAFPNLGKDYCVTAPATSKYNCFAWSVGITSAWMDKSVDTDHGNNNGKLEYSDFDTFYAKSGLKPVIGKTPKDAEVVLYGIGDKPTHAARRTGTKCGEWESKLGRNVRITHYPLQLAGGTVYGDINRYYVKK